MKYMPNRCQCKKCSSYFPYYYMLGNTCYDCVTCSVPLKIINGIESKIRLHRRIIWQLSGVGKGSV